MKSMHPKKQKKTSWGGVAKWYDAHLEKKDDTYHSRVILPNLMRLLDPKKGETVADIACGQGYFARVIAKSEAHVIASDISPELIALAKKQDTKNIEYHIASADKLTAIKNKGADSALIVLAIQNIEHFQEVFGEVARILKPHGRLLLVLNHPAFRIPGRISWEWDEKTHTQYRRVNGYLSDSHAKIQMHPGENPNEVTLSFHRPLQVYVKALAKNGFAITRLEEWISHRVSERGPRAQEEDRIRKEIPLFLALEATLLGKER
jgi:ubiquinone/menaquinone biosynthesis C-methylase UbiE